MGLLMKLAQGAVGFASHDIKIAGRIIEAGIKDGRSPELRTKYSIRRLKSAREQLKAAIILLEGEKHGE
jgi:hypothetical protein